MQGQFVAPKPNFVRDDQMSTKNTGNDSSSMPAWRAAQMLNLSEFGIGKLCREGKLRYAIRWHDRSTMTLYVATDDVKEFQLKGSFSPVATPREATDLSHHRRELRDLDTWIGIRSPTNVMPNLLDVDVPQNDNDQLGHENSQFAVREKTQRPPYGSASIGASTRQVETGTPAKPSLLRRIWNALFGG